MLAKAVIIPLFRGAELHRTIRKHHSVQTQADILLYVFFFFSKNGGALLSEDTYRQHTMKKWDCFG